MGRRARARLRRQAVARGERRPGRAGWQSRACGRARCAVRGLFDFSSTKLPSRTVWATAQEGEGVVIEL